MSVADVIKPASSWALFPYSKAIASEETPMPKPDIHLYTASTMNGWKPVIFLEEAEIDYDLTYIDFGKKEQKSDWYMRLNQIGRASCRERV